jgi:crotonobetainyl-CoA:carnitine CoA-transferase CaiB-like acyl-CoA transferase
MLGMSIIGALFQREKKGIGTQVEVPMMETMVDFTLVEHLYGYNFVPPKAPPIYPRQSSPNRRPYKTLDGYIAVMPYSDEQWLRFFKLIKKEIIFQDPKYSTAKSRNENINQLYFIMSKALEKEKTDYWIKNLKQNDIPVTKVNFPEDIFNDEHLKKTNFFKKNQHPTEGDLLYPSFPVEFDEDRNEEPLHAPNLGENTKDILSDLGFSEFEIDNLSSKGVIKIYIDES